jgi:hypothetical protein
VFLLFYFLLCGCAVYLYAPRRSGASLTLVKLTERQNGEGLDKFELCFMYVSFLMGGHFHVSTEERTNSGF